MIEVLRLSAENIRSFLALQEAGSWPIHTLRGDSHLPQLDNLHSIIARLERVLASYSDCPSQTVSHMGPIPQNTDT